jgi:hypothetical protein
MDVKNVYKFFLHVCPQYNNNDNENGVIMFIKFLILFQDYDNIDMCYNHYENIRNINLSCKYIMHREDCTYLENTTHISLSIVNLLLGYIKNIYIKNIVTKAVIFYHFIKYIGDDTFSIVSSFIKSPPVLINIYNKNINVFTNYSKNEKFLLRIDRNKVSVEQIRQIHYQVFGVDMKLKEMAYVKKVHPFDNEKIDIIKFLNNLYDCIRYYGLSGVYY